MALNMHLSQSEPFVYALQCLTGTVDLVIASVGRYTENTGYWGIEINTASFYKIIPKYCDRNY